MPPDKTAQTQTKNSITAHSNGKMPPLTVRQWCQRIWHTLRPLKIRQYYFLFIRRIWRNTYRPPKPHLALHQPLRGEPFLRHNPSLIKNQRFNFINQLSEFDVTKPQWRAEGYAKLWRYNLHYFEFLETDISNAQKAMLIDDWIQQNPLGEPDAWEPYPVSLRMVNWIKYWSRSDSPAPPQAWLNSLYMQGHWLTQNIEFHIDGNHLFKNSVALVFWSHSFTDPFATKWRNRAITLFTQELFAQFTQDGNHYERSPMYHALCLVFALDAYNLLAHNSPTDLTEVRSRLRLALNFLQTIVLPNGSIPLLKDSAYGIAPESQQIIDYACGLGIRAAENPATKRSLDVQWLSQAGYFIARQRGNYLLLDAGNIRPAHQPGHAHCDALHLELVLNDQPILCDTGVHSYAASTDRHYSRSTAAHNTLRINGAEQSDIWGQFRVGARAKVTGQWLSDQQFEGQVEQFSHNEKKYTHRRKIVINDFHDIVINDQVTGLGRCDIEVFWHLAPGVRLVMQNQQYLILNAEEMTVAVIKVQQSSCISSIRKSEYFPEFGLRAWRECLVISQADALLPWSLRTSISPMPAGVNVE